MSYLKQYLNQKNRILDMFGGPLMEVPINFEEAKPIFQKLAFDLSPENLARDGEATQAEVMARRSLFKGAWEELEEICGKKVFESDVY